VQILPGIIAAAHEKGLSFVTVSKLLEISAYK
jgi:hypothetical protein